MNRRLSVVVCTLAAIASLGGLGCQYEQVGAADAADAADEAVSVDTLSPAKTDLPRSVTQPATVHAYYKARIFAKVAGYLRDLKADIGQSVKRGDVLAVIDVPEMAQQREAELATIRRLEADQRRADARLSVAKASTDSYRARVAQAGADVGKTEAALAAERIELQRLEELVSQKAVADRLRDAAQKRYDAARAEKLAAEAAVASAEAELSLSLAQVHAADADIAVASAMTDVARRELDELDELIKYSRLVAPFDGVVTERNVDLGDLVRDTQTGSHTDMRPLFVVSQTDRVRVRVPVPERDAPLVDTGDEARLTLQALPGEVLQGKVSRLAGVLDDQTRTMLVEIDFPNPDGKLVPGMFGQATIVLEPPSERITLPANVVRYDEHGNSYLYVVDDSNRIRVIDVTTGLDDGEQIEISAGLTGDERVVGPSLRRLKAQQLIVVR